MRALKSSPLAKFQNGIISAKLLSQPLTDATVQSLTTLDWRPAMVAKKHDVYRVQEMVDRTQRDALAVGVDRARHLADELLRKISGPTIQLIEDFWDLSLKNLSAPQFTLYERGHFISAHRDDGAEYPDRLFSVVTYLSDEYGGGEIEFPTRGLSFHPEKSTTLIFPCDYIHSVAPITDGRKLVFLFFVDR